MAFSFPCVYTSHSRHVHLFYPALHPSMVYICVRVSSGAVTTTSKSFIYAGNRRVSIASITFPCPKRMVLTCREHRCPVISPHKWSVTRKMFPFYDVIMHPMPNAWQMMTVAQIWIPASPGLTVVGMYTTICQYFRVFPIRSFDVLSTVLCGEHDACKS